MAEETVPTEFTASEAPTEAREPGEVAEAEEAGELTAGGMYAGIRRFVEGVRDNFTVRTVYGEPIEAHGVTVVPVAQTYFGFGAGGGGGRSPGEEGANQGVGAGGAGGGVVRPIGFIEITASGSRWVPITRPLQRVAMGAVPALIALLAGRAARRRLLRAPERD